MQIKRVKEVIICKSLFINSLAAISQSPLLCTQKYFGIYCLVFDMPLLFCHRVPALFVLPL